MADNGTVLIRRKKIFADKELDSPELKSEKEEDDNEPNKRYSKALAIFLFMFSILTFLSLISYTVEDETNALTPISEIWGLFTGDEAIKFKAETTQNWLGLIGAIISYHLYNSIIGITIIGLPIFLVLFSKEIWTNDVISEKSLKSFAVYLTISIFFATMMAVINSSDIFGIMPKELSGNIGFFLSNLLISFIGHFGSFLLTLALIIATILIGTNLKIEGIINKFIESTEKVGPASKDAYNRIKEYQKIKKEEKAEKRKKDSQAKNSNNDSKENEAIKPESTQEIIESINVEPQKEKVEEPKINLRKDEQVSVKPKFKPLSLKISKSKNETSFEEKFENTEPEIIETTSELVDNSSNEESTNQEIVNESTDSIKIESTTNDTLVSQNQDDDISNELDNLMNELDLDDDFDKTDEDEIPNLEEIKPETIKPKLVLNVEEKVEEEPKKLESPLSTLIHDEEIDYRPPQIEILNPPTKQEGVDDAELEMNARILQEKLETFKIFIENLEITPGPVVTQYAFEPAAGIKISKIEALADDLAMALKAKGIRIIAPIPGKGLVGIEIPNNKPSLVTFSSVINSPKFKEKKLHLPIALGKTISGETAITDLAKTPHLLIAGATGAGKSVGVNTLVNSLLYKKLPSELKFVIIDPKKVELSQYKALKNHFIAMSPEVRNPIITDPVEAVAVLKSTVMEMEKRYDILAEAGQRNIADYNEKVKAGKYKDNTSMEHRPMPYIVVIVDEYADLMLTSGKEIEQPIVLLAQKARAVGIHLVLATQRPSVDVITGIIKANFPARIAYLVASKVDSRTILDSSGAEQLLGMGDMLFLPAGKPTADRIQNAFITTDEVDNICEWIGSQKGYSEPYWLPSIHDEDGGGAGMIDAADRDPLFRDAASLIIGTQQGSVSLIQRRLKVGYARAGRIMDELEDAGIVGPFEGSKARQVLFESESDLEAIL
jgi:S-DNA-T family DNA segregation ATPase FtsK/SpoIIIE